MYVPKHFEVTSVPALHGLMREHPLGTLVVLTSRGLAANHVPMEIDPVPGPFGTLRGHVARANPVWRDASADVEALVVFQGPDAYVSPSWYPSKRTVPKVVPTWNYAVVHAHGPVRWIEDRAWLRGLVERLTTRHESGMRLPWKIGDAPEDYIAKQLDAIVGIEIRLTRLVGKWKVSQNRPAEDRQGVAEALTEDGGDVARAMGELVRRPPGD